MSIKYTFEVELHPVKCPICGTVFAVEQSVLDNHFVCPRGHTTEEDSPTPPEEKKERKPRSPGEPKECPICHKTFTSLGQHMRRSHPEAE